MIRFLLGLLMVFGAVGGMDGTSDALLLQLGIAVAGLGLMYSGTRSMQ